MVQLAYYQHKLKHGYGTNVKLRLLAVEDLVLRKVLGTTKNPVWGKLGRALSDYFSSWNRSLLSGRPR